MSPRDLSDAERALIEMYKPALEDQIKSHRLLVDTLGLTPPIDPTPLWRRRLRMARNRLNDCYMHLRYGECDDIRWWEDNV